MFLKVFFLLLLFQLFGESLLLTLLEVQLRANKFHTLPDALPLSSEAKLTYKTALCMCIQT